MHQNLAVILWQLYYGKISFAVLVQILQNVFAIIHKSNVDKIKQCNYLHSKEWAI